eukprot:358718-Chlamydomonas_euryale.AAC.2
MQVVKRRCGRAVKGGVDVRSKEVWTCGRVECSELSSSDLRMLQSVGKGGEDRRRPRCGL